MFGRTDCEDDRFVEEEINDFGYDRQGNEAFFYRVTLDVGDVKIDQLHTTNPNFVNLHIRKRIKYHEPFIEYMRQLDGVDWFAIDVLNNKGYTFNMTKGSCFSWEEVFETLKRAVRSYTGV